MKAKDTQDTSSHPKTLKEFVDKTSNLLAALAVFVGLAAYMITIPDRILGMIATIGASISAALIVRELWNELPSKKETDGRLVQFKRIIIFTFLMVLVWGHLRYYPYLREFLWFEMVIVTFSFMAAKDKQIRKFLRPSRKFNLPRSSLFFVILMASIFAIPYGLRLALDCIVPLKDYVNISGVGLATLLATYGIVVLATLFLGKYPLDDET